MRLQSALEYVTTYGWAILIIAIALVALILLGLFNVNVGGGTYCVGEAGYTCSNPILNSSGYLSLTFSEAPNPITLTGTACSLNDSVPSYILSSPSPISISPYTNYRLLFICPVPSGTLGTHIIDTLWIRTDPQGDPSQVTRIGTVSVSVTTNGTVISTVASTSTVASSTSITGASTSTTVASSTVTAYYQCGGYGGGAECPSAGGECPARCPVLYNGCPGQSCPGACPTSGITCLNLTTNDTLTGGSFYACSGATPDGVSGTYSWTATSYTSSTSQGQSYSAFCEGSATSGDTAPVIEGITVCSGCLLNIREPTSSFDAGTVVPSCLPGRACTRGVDVNLNYDVPDDGSYVVALFAMSNYSAADISAPTNCSVGQIGLADIDKPSTAIFGCVENSGSYSVSIYPAGSASTTTNASIEVFVFSGGGNLSSVIEN